MSPAKIILIALTLTLPNLAASPQHGDKKPTEPTTPTLKVYTRETIVDVTVTDAKGNPVHGLKQSDFTLKEDGKPQPIRSFHEYSAQPAQPLPKLPPNVYTNLQPPAPSAAINVLWLDFTNLAPNISGSVLAPLRPYNVPAGPADLVRAVSQQRLTKQEAIKWLHNSPPGTRVVVLASSNPGHLRILQGITSDASLLSAAIDTLEYDTYAIWTGDEATWCAQQEERNQMTLESLDQIAANLAGIRGRKNLVWFTHGIPTITDPAQSRSCLTDYSSELKKAYGLLTAAQVTVYPIGAAGNPAPPYPLDDWLSMESVAEATGGAAYYNNNDLAAEVGKAVDKGSDYYTLSYVPPGSEYDGRHHTINLKTAQPGLHLTYRNEYYAEDPTKMAPAPGLSLVASATHPGDLATAMGRAMPTATDLLFDVQVEPTTQSATPPVLGNLDPKFSKKQLTRYSFQYAIPARQFSFTSGPNSTHKGALELDIAVYDAAFGAEGKPITSLSQTVQMPLSEARYQQFIKGPFRFIQQLDLPPGPLFVRIGILDHTSNKIGTLEIPLTVPKK